MAPAGYEDTVAKFYQRNGKGEPHMQAIDSMTDGGQPAQGASSELNVRIPEHLASGGTVELSPIDVATLGRATPMVWFYAETLDSAALVSALQETLVAYPVLCGRYASTPPTAVNLSNAGVPVEIATEHRPEMALAGATAHVSHNPSEQSQSFFSSGVVDHFLPVKAGMDPDAGSTEAPILKIKITALPGGGTAIGMLAQHGVVDGDAQINFFQNWSRVFRGLALQPAPMHERTILNTLPTGDLAVGEKPPGFKVKVVPPGEPNVPEFAPVLQKIGGSPPQVTTMVPLALDTLKKLKKAASAGVPEGQFVSTDDVVTALVWRAQCKQRCTQLGLPLDSDEPTTLSRACNFRKLMTPLLDGYFANGVTTVVTELTIREVFEINTSALALKLRSSLKTFTPENVAARAQWLLQQQQQGCKTPTQFDKNALTFMVSSWGFRWQDVDFNSKPLCFDHAAHVALVAVITPRPNDDGVNVYASGTQESLEQFGSVFKEAIADVE